MGLLVGMIAISFVSSAQFYHLNEDFNNVNPGELPAEWYLGDGGTVVDQTPPLNEDSTWTVVTKYGTSNDLGDGNFVFIRYNTGDTQDDTLFTDTIDLTSFSFSNLFLSFKHYFNFGSAPNAAYVGIKYFDGTNWTLTWIDSFKTDVGGWGTSAALQSYNLNSFIGTAQKLMIVFRYVDSDDWYWAIDQVQVMSFYDHDLRAASVVDSVSGRCPLPNDTLYAIIYNSGTQIQDFSVNPLTITIELTDPNSNTVTRTQTINTGTITPGNSQAFAVAPFDLTVGGTYNYKMYITYTLDQNNANDTIANSFNIDVYSLPEQVDFTGYDGTNLSTLFPAWDEASGSVWGGYTVGNTWGLVSDEWANDPAHPNDTSIRRNFFGTSDQYMIISKPFAVTSTQDIRFSFDYVSTDYTGTALTDAYNSDDSVIVYYSTNCGASWNVLGVLDSSLLQSAVHPNGSKFSSIVPNTSFVSFAIYMRESATNPNSRDINFYVDNINIDLVYSNDLTVSNVRVGTVQGCPSNSDTVEVTITNVGSSDQTFGDAVGDTLYVYVVIDGVNTGTQTLVDTVATGTLLADSSLIVKIAPVNFMAVDTYSVTAYLVWALDQNNANDSLALPVTRVVYYGSLPEQVDFTGYNGSNLPDLFPAWDEATGSIWGGYTVGNNWGLVRDDWANDPTHPNGESVRRNFFGTDGKFMLISEPFAVTSTQDIRFSFDYVSTDYTGTALTDAYNRDDSVIVYYSTNCGVSWNVLGVLDSSLLQSAVHPDGSKFSSIVPNTSFVSFAIYMRESATDSNNRDINFYVDNINIDLVYSNDLTVSSVRVGMVQGCPSNSDTVEVTITNVGALDQTFGDAIGDTLYVYVVVDGVNTGTQTLVDTVTTGTLLADSSLIVKIAPVNFMAADTYSVTAYLVWALDQNNANDTLILPSAKVVYYANMPQRVDFTGYDGSNLSTVFPGWEEADGIPSSYTITDASWTDDTWANINGHPNGTAIKYNMWSSGYKSIMFISPLINVPANNDLTFTFDNVIVDWGQSTLADTLNGEDSIIVYYTTDCGISWTPIYSLDSTNAFMAAGPDGYNANYLISNTGFNFIQFAFRAVRGTTNNTGRDIDIMFDNINIDTTKNDIAVTDITIADNNPCPSEDSIFVTVKNVGGLPADLGSNNLTITVDVSGPATGSYSITIGGDTLLFAQDTTVFVGAFDFSQAGGVYQITAYITWSPDGDAVNDTLAKEVYNALNTVASTQVDFNSWDGTPLNLFLNYDFWWENEDLANDNSWEAEDWANMSGTPNDTSAEFEFWGSFGFDIAVIGSPFISTNNYNSLYFGYDVALTDRWGPTNDSMDIADTVFVAFSNDCGATWSLITLYSRGNEPDSAGRREEFVIPTTGTQYVQFLFVAKDLDHSGAGSYSFYLDNINVAYYDVATSTITTVPPNYACENQNVDVSVEVLNNSTSTVDSLFYTATAYYNGTPIASASGNMPLTIASGAIATLNNILSFTMPDTGSVDIMVVTRSFPVDFNGSNDTLWLTVEAAYVNATLSLPDTAYSGTPTSVLVSIAQYGTTYDDIIWNFGPNATPQTASGTGPFSVAWNVTTSQYEQVTVTIYSCNYGDTLVLYDSVFVVVPSGVENAQLGNLMVLQDGERVTLKVIEGEGITKAIIRDISGKELFARDYRSAKQITINMKGYPAGIYMLNIVSGDKERTIRIIKD